MQHLLSLIHQYGDWFYLVTFIWTALEGESFVILAAFLAQKGILNIWLLFSAAWAGSFCGDQMFFFIGRFFGRWLLRRFPKLQPKIDKVNGSLNKYMTGFILTYRFMYGVRNVSGIALGMTKLPWKRFVWLNALAALIWAVAFCGSGYFFGSVIARLGRRKEEVVNYNVREIMLIALAIFIAFVIGHVVLTYRKRKKAAQEAKGQDNITD